MSESAAGVVTGVNGREPRVVKGQTAVELIVRISDLPIGALAAIELAEGTSGENGISNISLIPGSDSNLPRLRFDVAADANTGARRITISANDQRIVIIDQAFNVSGVPTGPGPRTEGFCDRNPSDPMCRF